MTPTSPPSYTFLEESSNIISNSIRLSPITPNITPVDVPQPTTPLPVHQLDVKNAFLHDDLSQTVYMHQPSGLWDSAYPDYVCLLKTSLFGLKQASLAWFQRSAAYITRVGFHHRTSVFVTRDSSRMFLSQRKYVFEILERARMVNCNPIQTPIDTDSKLGDDGGRVPCLYMHDPREPHFSALKRILRYVHGTLDHGLQLFSSSTTSLVTYSDVDWAGCSTTRRLTSEAEYHGVANAVAETCWLRNLLRELHTHLSSATLVYCDNTSAVYFSSNSVQQQ
ncbi:ribonuclease H-like domain-containing protein, partial [Tanacetum coccineum]